MLTRFGCQRRSSSPGGGGDSGHLSSACSPQRSTAARSDWCSHIVIEFRSETRFDLKQWNELGVHSKATRVLLRGATEHSGCLGESERRS